MIYDIISTGSKGNAVVINKEILIDCGVPYKLLKPYIKPLKLVLLTHIHGDHFKPSTVEALSNERPALRWGCCEWMVEPLLSAGVNRRMIDLYEPGIEQRYWDFCFLKPELLTHNVPNCCYHIRFPEGRLFYATDTGTLDGIEAKNYDLYMIEANHTQAEMEARLSEKLEKGEFAYETAAAANHLSQEQAEDWLYQNMGPKSKYVFLHQHE